MTNFTKPSKIADCEHCPLKLAPYVNDLHGESSTLIVGDSPTVGDLVRREAFSDQSGQIIKSVAPNAYMTNMIACRQLENTTTDERNQAIKCCAPRLNQLVNQAETVILLGASVANQYGIKDKGVRHGKFFSTITPSSVYADGNKYETLKRDVLWAKFGVELDWAIVEDAQGHEADFIAGEPIIWDVETIGLYGPLYFIALACPRLKKVFIVREWDTKWNKCNLIAHNSKYDLSIVPEAECDADTMLMHYTMHENDEHGLKALCARYFGVGDWQSSVEIEDLSKTSWADAIKYAAQDVMLTWYLYRVLLDEMDEKAHRLHQFLLESALTLRVIELNGVRIDQEQLVTVEKLLDENIKRLTNKLRVQLIDPVFNPASPQQVADIIYNELELPDPKLYNSQKKRKVQRSTDDDTLVVLEKVDTSGFIKTIKEYRRIAKIKSSYIKPLKKFVKADGRVHPTFNLHRAETGRLSANNPALQTIPRAESANVSANQRYGAMIRSLFVPDDGFTFVESDYSQAELRAVAALSGEPFLLNVYAQGQDLHSEVARAIFGDKFTKNQRVICKTINFGWLYGANAGVIAKQTGIDIAEATKIVKNYEANMPVLVKWRQDQFDFALKNRYVETQFGRRRRFPLIHEKNFAEIRKASVNMPVQSVASDLTLCAANQLVHKVKIVLLVHDSILVECPIDDAPEIGLLVSDTMREMGELYLPQVKWAADYEIKSRWAQSPFLEVNGSG